MYTQETLDRKIAVAESSIETLAYQIKNLQKFVNPLQVQMWRKNKRSLNKQLDAYRKKYKKYYGKKPVAQPINS